jgi:hypothetical protein
MAQDEPFLTFVGASNIDPTFQQRLEKEFVPRRLTFKRKTRGIISSA